MESDSKLNSLATLPCMLASIATQLTLGDLRSLFHYAGLVTWADGGHAAATREFNCVLGCLLKGCVSGLQLNCQCNAPVQHCETQPQLLLQVSDCRRHSQHRWRCLVRVQTNSS